MNNNFYVNIKNPGELKDAFLECSDGMAESLKNYSDFNLLRDRKNAYMIKLNEAINEIARLSERLGEILPEWEGDEQKSTPLVKTTKRRAKKYNIKELNDELQNIEKKMSDLNV